METKLSSLSLSLSLSRAFPSPVFSFYCSRFQVLPIPSRANGIANETLFFRNIRTENLIGKDKKNVHRPKLLRNSKLWRSASSVSDFLFSSRNDFPPARNRRNHAPFLCSSSTRNSISPNLIDDIFPVPVGGKGMSHFRGEQGRG